MSIVLSLLVFLNLLSLKILIFKVLVLLKLSVLVGIIKDMNFFEIFFLLISIF